MRTLTSSLAFVWLVLTLPAALVAQGSAAPGVQNVLTPGDSVRIVVWRKPEFSGDYVVAARRTITHPLFRAVKVAGLPFAKRRKQRAHLSVAVRG